jgi:predicted hotdog family 3-hydroxylacyl-ACP dehydratase
VTVGPRIDAIVPHAGKMCLLERIVSWDDNRVTLATTTHRDPANPLARDGRLRAIHLCEYGAQAMAVHGGLVAMARGERARPGLLVSLRDIVLACDFIEQLEGELLVEAMRVHGGAEAWQYDFRVSHAGRPLAHGRAMVSLASAT